MRTKVYREPHFLIAFFAGVFIAICVLVSSCGKNPAEVFFHPCVDARFADSQAMTPPAAISVDPDEFNFAMFSDVHKLEGNPTLLSRFGADVVSKNISFFVVVGDLTENATTKEFNEVKSELTDVGRPYYAAIGNHDLFQAADAGGWGGWKSTFGPGTYSVTIGGVVRFIFLDSASGDIGDSQFAWLQSQLATKVQYTFVCSHYPIYDGMIPWIYRLESYEERFHLASLLNKNGVYMYVAGHLHGFRTGQVGQVQHLIVGSMYPGTLDVGNHGYVLFSYKSGKLSWNWIPF